MKGNVLKTSHNHVFPDNFERHEIAFLGNDEILLPSLMRKDLPWTCEFTTDSGLEIHTVQQGRLNQLCRRIFHIHTSYSILWRITFATGYSISKLHYEKQMHLSKQLEFVLCNQ